MARATFSGQRSGRPPSRHGRDRPGHRGARHRRVGRVRRARRGGAGRGAGRRAARQAGGRDVPERDHGPAGGARGSGASGRARSGWRSPTCPTSSSTRTTGRAGCTASDSSTSRLGRASPTVDDLDRLGAGLGAVLLELPLRDAGCLLPDWDDLVALSREGPGLGCRLHLDGARIWESQPFYDRTLAEIAGVGRQRLRLVLQGPGRARRRLPGRRRGRRRGGPALAQADGRHALPPDAARRRRP